MNTLNYIGSKHTLFKTILGICQQNIADMTDFSFMDLFAGTGTVGFNMQTHFKSCDANDLETYSYIINYALLKCNYSEKLADLIKECTELEGVEGLIYRNYSEMETCTRMFFTNENAKKADAIREFIESCYKETGRINIAEYYFLLASLLVSIDKVANTTCVYGAYLKKYKKAALKAMNFVPIHTKTDINIGANNVYNRLAESFTAVDNDFTEYDVIYLDPPYNQRQYSGNYSPLNYIAKYDEALVLKGNTGLIENYNKSSFCKKGDVVRTFTDLIAGLRCKYLIISYNNEGLISMEEFKKIVMKKGFVKLYKIQYNKFKAQQTVTEQYVEEYLWIIDCLRETGFEEIVAPLIK